MKTIISGNRRLSNIHCYSSVHYDFKWCSVLNGKFDTHIDLCISVFLCIKPIDSKSLQLSL